MGALRALQEKMRRLEVARSLADTQYKPDGIRTRSTAQPTPIAPHAHTLLSAGVQTSITATADTAAQGHSVAEQVELLRAVRSASSPSPLHAASMESATSSGNGKQVSPTLRPTFPLPTNTENIKGFTYFFLLKLFLNFTRFSFFPLVDYA